jgi:hypothetical protein
MLGARSLKEEDFLSEPHLSRGATGGVLNCVPSMFNSLEVKVLFTT